MNITKRQLKQIIEEELQNVLSEGYGDVWTAPGGAQYPRTYKGGKMQATARIGGDASDLEKYETPPERGKSNDYKRDVFLHVLDQHPWKGQTELLPDQERQYERDKSLMQRMAYEKVTYWTDSDICPWHGGAHRYEKPHLLPYGGLEWNDANGDCGKNPYTNSEDVVIRIEQAAEGRPYSE